MLDGLLKSKFYTKCKANVKFTKTRAETIKRKKMAVQKFLKNDIADLLKNGLDMNAYSRTEGFLIEQNMTRCYDLVENFCVTLTNNLSLMDKQSECPEECREAVASLIYAAARFSDLPELRDLRSINEERYGNSVQAYISREFIERLSPRTYTKEMKLQLLQDIANESSIRWNSKALEQKLFSPPTIQGSETELKSNRSNKDRYKVQSSSSDDESTVTSWNDPKTSSSSAASLSDDEGDSRTMPFQGGGIRPPPYLKPKPGKSSSVEDNKPKPRSVRQRNSKLKPPPGYENNARLAPKTVEDQEETMMDDLLMRYSNKKSYFEPASESVRGRRQELSMPPSRVASLPSKQKTMLERGTTRLASFQPDGPPRDYDELAARIAALRGK